MLVATIQNVELSGILSVTAETIKFFPSDETSTGVRIKFDTKENTFKFVEGLYHRDTSQNPIIDTGDDWVLLDMEILRKLELTHTVA